MSKVDKKFEEKIKQTVESEALIQDAEDEKLAANIRRGDQIIYIDGIGDIIFKWPYLDLTTESDRIYAEYYSQGLSEGRIKTKAQLAAIYARPTEISENGARVKVNNGLWTAQDDLRLDEIPNELKSITNDFNDFRKEIQDIENELGALDEHSKSKKKNLETKRTALLDRALQIFSGIESLNKEYLELNARYLQLFSSCLEEQANMQKLKFLAPECLFVKEGEMERPLWKDREAFLKSRDISIKIFSIFSLFMRGGSIHFFADSQENTKI